MCGIVASVSKRGRVSPDALLRATQRLRHRGPDAQHVWVPPHARVGLGHARLSIIDLATGDQPIARGREPPPDRQRRTLRLRADPRGPESRGFPFRTRSDSEIALHLYDDVGRPLPAPPARRVRLHHLGRARRPALRRARPLRHQAALLRDHDGASYSPPRSRLCWRWASPPHGTRDRLDQHGLCTALAIGLRRHPSGAAGTSAAGHRRRRAPAPLLGPSAAGTADQRAERSPDDGTRRGTGRDQGATGRGGTPEAARRRAGRLLPERRPRLLRRSDLGHPGSGPGRSTPSPAFDHADYDEAPLAEEHRGARAQSSPCLRSEHLADASRPRSGTPRRPASMRTGRQVPAQPGGARCRLQGGADRRRLGRTVRRLPVFPPGHALNNTQGQNPATVRGCCRGSTRPTMCPTASSCRRATAVPNDCVRRTLGFVPTIMETLAGRRVKRWRSLLYDDFKAAYRGRDTFRVFLNHFDVERQLAGRDAVEQALYRLGKTALPNYILTPSATAWRWRIRSKAACRSWTTRSSTWSRTCRSR